MENGGIAGPMITLSWVRRRARPPKRRSRPEGRVKEEKKEFWIYGAHSVRAVLEKRPAAVRELLIAEEGGGRCAEAEETARRLGLPVRRVSPRELSAVCGSTAHQGLAVRAPLPPYAGLAEVLARPPFVVIALDGITDPQNLGAMIRTAEALGSSGIVLPRDRSARLSAAVHKTSAGAMEFLPVCQVVNLSRALREMKKHGYWIFAADPRGEIALPAAEFSLKSVILIGAEGRGLRPGILKEADFRVRIQLAGHTESLNAGAACAILISWVMGRKDVAPGDS